MPNATPFRGRLSLYNGSFRPRNQELQLMITDEAIAPAPIAEKQAGTPLVQVEGISKKFGDFTAVNNISFQVNHREIFGFLGPNGAGKSTTIKMICTLLAPTGGRIIVD